MSATLKTLGTIALLGGAIIWSALKARKGQWERIKTALSSRETQINIAFIGPSQNGKSTLNHLLNDALQTGVYKQPIGGVMGRRTTKHLVRQHICTNLNVFDAPGFVNPEILRRNISAMRKGILNGAAFFDINGQLIPVQELPLDPANAINQWVVVINALKLCESIEWRGMTGMKVVSRLPDDVAQFLKVLPDLRTLMSSTLPNSLNSLSDSTGHDRLSIVLTHIDGIDADEVPISQLKQAIMDVADITEDRIWAINAKEDTLQMLNILEAMICRNMADD